MPQTPPASETPRRRRTKRPNVVLQERDLAVLRGLYESRTMTLRHAADLHFGGSYEYAKRRLRDLRAAGLVRVRKRTVVDADALFLARRGHEALLGRGALAGLPAMRWPSLQKRSDVSPLTLDHELDVMGVKAAVARAVADRDDLAVEAFTTWPRLARFRARRHLPRPWEGPTMMVNPDGFLHLLRRRADGTAGRTFFYLEVDRSTETLATLVGRMQGYRDHYERGGLAARFGASRSDWKRWPFRVLWTFRSPERRANVAAAFAAASPAVGGQALLALFDDAVADPLEPVWRRPKDAEDGQRLVGE